MTAIVSKWALNKSHITDNLAVGGTEDPYYEPEDANKKRSWYHRKHMKQLPAYLSENDIRVLKSVRQNAYRLDLQVKICGYRLGWAGIIGLIPVIGDFLACCCALMVVRKAGGIDGGLPALTHMQMIANVAFDFGMGLIPIVGDLVNIAYKCNSRNYVLLEKHLVHKYKKRGADTEGATGREIHINPNLVEDLETHGANTLWTEKDKTNSANAPQPI
ncbi:hypothetical protein BABINDRAFT_179231 [Babjeviella inositovora NRRL Y-12698]|uniref:DUF4112 domain-containing protein n=1 Tax=Babjeviella inositovora NRRL Y-12698 TaxID=984486 RepID=A0A1E3QV28_9ASCO|nr:uncharacterized protein BABINDRAFT_179231 [Babjeviella inositovora NRRL Y-12698]ODQ81520.1 hypothetical protein BABINDRAFT_179231 [Babjeviella inositovora NRRL Y-12698]